MIQIYSPFNDEFDKNGDSVLNPIYCIAHFELNDVWYLEIKHPLDEKAHLIVENAVLKVPTFLADEQLYRIDKIIDRNLQTITALAYPIFFDSANEVFIFDKRPTNKNGQEALNDIFEGTKYRAESDIRKVNTAYYINKNGMSAVNGSDENSFINRWGGEAIYNNYTLIMNERAGIDRGFRAEFGFNLKSIKETIDMENVVTKIVPIGANGYMLPNNEVVESPLINSYPKVYTRAIEYSDVVLAEDSSDGEGLTKEEANLELKRLANLEFEKGLDKPMITYGIDIVDLSKTEQYKDFEELTRINLGDDILCKVKKLGIDIKSRCVGLDYDCILKKNNRVILGNFKKDFFNESSDITSSVSKVVDTSNNTLMASRIAGVINMLNTSLRAQKGVAQKQDVRAILFEDLDPNSATFGALCIGTQGIQISKKRTADGTDWQWGTAIDFQSINADYMMTGILTDRNGKFYLNLDTGKLMMKDGTFAGVVNGGEINGTIINSSEFNASRERTCDVRSGDKELIKNFILGNISLSEEEKKRLDFCLDGRISSLDYIYAEDMLSGQLSKQWIDYVKVNADDASYRVLVGTKNNGNQNVKRETNIYGGAVETSSIYTSSLVTNTINSPKDKNDNSYLSLSVEPAKNTGLGISLGIYNSVSAKNTMYKVDNDCIIAEKIGATLSNESHFIFSGVMPELYFERPYIDFHAGQDPYSKDYTQRIIANSQSGNLVAEPGISNASDERMKKDIKDIDINFSNELLKKLKPVQFRYRKTSDALRFGLIAQDVEKSLLEIGFDKNDLPIVDKPHDKDNYYSLDYIQLIALLINGWKVHEKEINELKKVVMKND